MISPTFALLNRLRGSQARYIWAPIYGLLNAMWLFDGVWWHFPVDFLLTGGFFVLFDAPSWNKYWAAFGEDWNSGKGVVWINNLVAASWPTWSDRDKGTIGMMLRGIYAAPLFAYNAYRIGIWWDAIPIAILACVGFGFATRYCGLVKSALKSTADIWECGEYVIGLWFGLLIDLMFALKLMD